VNRSKRPLRRVAVVGALVASVLLVAAPAWAHVTVQPGSAVKGSFSILDFSVPNESDTASTTSVAVEFPTATPIASVRVQPKPGWTYTVEKSTLPKPVKTESGELTEAVSTITWTGGEIKPGEFELFTISAGPLPTKGKSIAFPATQTYSDGEVVNWNEKTPPGGEEPEHPAPTLKLTKVPSSGGGGH
jgi:periplasmic copper chaperone A